MLFTLLQVLAVTRCLTHPSGQLAVRLPSLYRTRQRSTACLSQCTGRYQSARPCCGIVYFCGASRDFFFTMLGSGIMLITGIPGMRSYLVTMHLSMLLLATTRSV